MDVEFDPAKDKANIAKRGVSLAWASSLDVQTTMRDLRADYGEERFNAVGLINGAFYCLT